MFWFISKTVGALLMPMTWILLSNIFALLALWKNWRKLAFLLIAFTPVFLLSLKYFTIPARLATPLEYTYPALAEIPSGTRGMIILGGASEYYASPDPLMTMNEAGERIAMAMYARAVQPNLPLVVTGASRSLTSTYKSEARRIHDFLESTFPDAGPIYVDEKSLNTAQHPIKLKSIIPDWNDGRWILVTSAVHMPRSVALFEKQGWTVIPMPTDYLTDAQDPKRTHGKILWNLKVLSRTTHEWFGLIVYKLTGKI